MASCIDIGGGSTPASRRIPSQRLDQQRAAAKAPSHRHARAGSTQDDGEIEILLAANEPGLLNGGLAGLFWSLLWTYAGQTFVVLSLAELSSMAPTAGGHHHWVSDYAPRKWRRSLSYTAGWLACIAWQSISATDCYIIADVLQALITIQNPDYIPTRWAATLLTIATAIVLSAFNTFAARHLTVSEGVFTTCHVFAFVPIFVTLWVMVSPKTTPAEAFLHVRDHTNTWPTSSISTLVGQTACIYATSGSDSVIHLADEFDNPALTVPRGIVWAFALNFPMAFIMLVTYIVNLGSVDQALNGQHPPFVAVFWNALESRGAVMAFTVVILALLIMITISALAATSRQTFVFARDHGLPFSLDLRHVSRSCQVPINAIFATACITSLLALLQLGSETAMNATLPLACAALMATTALTLSVLLHYRLTHKQQPPTKPRWSLAPFSTPINILALAYATWSLFWSLWPSDHHPSTATFNWASVILIVTMGVAAGLYHFDGRRRYQAPVNVIFDEGEAGAGRS